MASKGKPRPKDGSYIAMRKDGDANKHLPNGLVILLKAIRMYSHDGKGQMTRDSFARLFLPTYNNCVGKYAKETKEDYRALSKWIERIEGNDAGIQYSEIRAYADYVGIAPGALILLSQYLTRDAELSDNEQGKYLLNRISRLYKLSRMLRALTRKAIEEGREPFSSKKHSANNLVGISVNNFQGIMSAIKLHFPRDEKSGYVGKAAEPHIEE